MTLPPPLRTEQSAIGQQNVLPLIVDRHRNAGAFASMHKADRPIHNVLLLFLQEAKMPQNKKRARRLPSYPGQACTQQTLRLPQVWGLSRPERVSLTPYPGRWKARASRTVKTSRSLAE